MKAKAPLVHAGSDCLMGARGKSGARPGLPLSSPLPDLARHAVQARRPAILGSPRRPCEGLALRCIALPNPGVGSEEGIA